MELDVELRGVTKRYGEVAAVDALSLGIRRGEFLSLLGPSGCGKTTTLRLIAGFEHPDEGSLLLGGEDVSSRPPYKRDVNTVFQSYALFPHLTVLENVAYGLKQRRVDRTARELRARAALELVRLTGLESRRPRERGRTGTGCASSDDTASGSPRITSAVPRAWSNLIRTSATTKRLSGRPVPSSGRGTVGSRRAAKS